MRNTLDLEKEYLRMDQTPTKRIVPALLSSTERKDKNEFRFSSPFHMKNSEFGHDSSQSQDTYPATMPDAENVGSS